MPGKKRTEAAGGRKVCWRYENQGCRYGVRCKDIHQERYDRPGPGGIWQFPPDRGDAETTVAAPLEEGFEWDIFGDTHSDGHGGRKVRLLMRGEPEPDPEKDPLHRMRVGKKWQVLRDKLLQRAERAEEHVQKLLVELKEASKENVHLRQSVQEGKERHQEEVSQLRCHIKETEVKHGKELSDESSRSQQLFHHAADMQRLNGVLRQQIHTHRANHKAEREEHELQLSSMRRASRHLQEELVDAKETVHDLIERTHDLRVRITYLEGVIGDGAVKPALFRSESQCFQAASAAPTDGISATNDVGEAIMESAQEPQADWPRREVQCSTTF